MSFVVYADGRQKAVKNLGWLRRHFALVSEVYVSAAVHRSWDVTLDVRLSDGRRFLTQFADRTVCRAWLRRPSLRGVPLWWLGVETTCDALATNQYASRDARATGQYVNRRP